MVRLIPFLFDGAQAVVGAAVRDLCRKRLPRRRANGGSCSGRHPLLSQAKRGSPGVKQPLSGPGQS